MMWFTISGLVAIFSSMALYLWLLRQGAGVVTAMSGIPGYLELRYREVCRRRDRSGTVLLVARAIIYVNTIWAAAVAIPLLASRVG